MSSPFSTLEEFNGAIDGPTGGAIYTFANAPMINNIALLASVGIFIWFIVKTYNTHAEPPAMDRSLSKLSTFIVVSLLSIVAVTQGKPSQVEPQNFAAASERLLPSSRRTVPLGVLGIAGVSMQTAKTALSRRGRKRRKSRGGRYNPKR